MSKRSSIALGTILKNFARVSRHPWIASRLAALEKEKILFKPLNPRAHEGVARSIRQVSVRITDICNLRCHTCGQWGDQGFLHCADLKALKKSEVSPERYHLLLADLATHGHFPSVYLWGGEPTMYKGWLEIIEHATVLRMPTSIATNSTGIAKAAERLVKAPMFLLQMSIDGPDADTHNAARPSASGADNFQSILDALDAVNQAKKAAGKKLPLTASLTTISQANVGRLVDIYETFKDKVDLFVFYLSWWIDEDSAKAHDADFERRFGQKPKLHWGWVGDWTIKEYALLDAQLKEVMRRSKGWDSPAVNIIPNITGVDNLREYYTDHSQHYGYDQCISIYQAVEIDSGGDMSPCRDYHDYVVGNVKQNTITEIWNNEAYRKFRASLTTQGLMPACTRCCGLMGY
ncbi:Sporulation killing factor maturation protein SkfB [Fundidesulfovibrio magnetotacticus]|uniref:Sporulation killing factor maturation protein SkfB n=1 Tax=Fundidesulfovibrio magnetotacticus TaxID=2730080 RepID=A0A6V8M5C3_9BACT|nr:radical SAM protein [Fundidesulfovibrio magnetotacticus]GFK95745.1 Sporulation killing factor maturation protein SkfB [Fundidesulfovibrio magnetotacticus]